MKTCGKDSSHQAESGSALIPVILMIGLFTLLVTSFSVFTSNSATSMSVTRLRIANNALVQSAVEFGMGRVLSTPKALPIIGEDRIRLKAGEARISWRAETARLDINLADEAFLTSLLYEGGLRGDDAEQLARRIVERRAGKAPNGGQLESQNTPNANLGRFAHIRELREVPGMTSEVFARITPYITVFGMSSAIDPRLADRELLGRVPGISKPIVAELFALRGAKDERAKDAIASLGELARFFAIGQQSAVRFVIKIGIPPGTIRTYEVVTLHFNDDVRPYLILSWREIVSPSEQVLQ